jgi:ribosomal protein S18 acetylase RimI-like enzyme
MREIEIHLLRLEQAEALVELAGHIWRSCYPGIISTGQIEYMLAQRYKPGLVKQLIARGDLWLGAQAGDELIGFAHGHPLQDGDYKLDKLYVHPDWQRHGIGGKLIGEVERHAREHRCTRLLLRVNRQNQRAIDAYLKPGFTVATIIMEDIGGGYVMDDYVMVKNLPTA